MSLVDHIEEGFSLFHLLGVVSGTFQTLYLVMACSEPFHFLQATKSQNVLTSKFTINQLHVRFYYKRVHALL